MPVPTHVQHEKNIWVAAGDGDLGRVRELIETCSISPNVPDAHTYTPMHAAASYGQVHVLEYLISKGGDVNVTDGDGDTPLYVVENVETAQYLVEHGAIVNRRNSEGITPAQYLSEDFEEVAAYLDGIVPAASGGDSTPLSSTASPARHQPSQHAQDAASETLTSSLIQSVQDIMQRAGAEGRDPDDELRQAVGRTVLEGVATGYDMSVGNEEDREDRDNGVGPNGVKRPRRGDGPGFTKHISLSDLPNESADSAATEESPISQAKAQAKDYEAICCPLTTEKWKTRWREMCLLPAGDIQDKESLERRAEAWRSRPGFLCDEVTITRLDEAEGVLVMVSDWLELDAMDDWVRHDSETALLQELAYASYLNIPCAILPPPRNRSQIAAYARAVNACLNAVPYTELSIRIPIYDPAMLHLSPATPKPTASVSSSTVLFSDEPSVATWEMWDAIRTVCDYNPRLSLTLDLTPPMPSVMSVLGQWSAEPVRHVFLPSSTFIPNAKGYPVLPKVTQSFIRDIMKLQPNVILSGTASGRHKTGGEAVYSQYVRYLEKTSPVMQATQTPGTVDNFAQGYHDFLQAPLQPLMDNLPSVTYQTFEQDPVKYRQYEEAVYLSLLDRPQEERLVLCVAGAGRGPLVARCLSALARSNRNGVVYVLEKNPNAYVTLQQRQQSEWGDKVQLVFGDMRTSQVPEKVDILVSELLGSFGDNELSPECLDGAMRFLKPEGISIPSSYTAHIAPLSSSRLLNETRAMKDLKICETPHVVMFRAINILSDDGGGLSGNCGPKVQECWEFEHPRREAVLDEQGLPPTNSHNARSAKMIFNIPHAGSLHGLAGYFEAVLYRNIGLSIHPDRMQYISKDMLSWFPLFFPFKEPLYLPGNSELHVYIWRLTNQRQVWYEWYAEAFLPVPGASSVDPHASIADHRSSRQSTQSMLRLSPSPIADAVDDASDDGKMEDVSDKGNVGLIKIGQTTLHNPRGRSSWIGL
ncbi:uncharacterized protein FIBRA_06475 [Fibroporia radiculosa]|uniref:Uncharacterized protein n=1 Tax=Fibroporia radiculosa TaxID=599839 RepID=J4H435_9APHY|nr:uncharacterized protein FIBRA_06475 [Fibroporia radiculosa]CCM04304.1 predicted protein [Fibroporia radiculosa]